MNNKNQPLTTAELEAAAVAIRGQARSLSDGPARRSVLLDALKYEEEARLQRLAMAFDLRRCKS
jgi:hypothetical protein